MCLMKPSSTSFERKILVGNLEFHLGLKSFIAGTIFRGSGHTSFAAIQRFTTPKVSQCEASRQSACVGFADRRQRIQGTHVVSSTQAFQRSCRHFSTNRYFL